MTLAERQSINTLTTMISDADYEGAKTAIIEGIKAWSTEINILSYNIPIEGTLARNGQKYRCIITNGVGNQVTSKSITIYVECE